MLPSGGTAAVVLDQPLRVAGGTAVFPITCPSCSTYLAEAHYFGSFVRGTLRSGAIVMSRGWVRCKNCGRRYHWHGHDARHGGRASHLHLLRNGNGA